MEIYLPIAGLPVNIIIILLIGLISGFLSGLFGIGGGFISTPLLMFTGVPPAVAVSTSPNQIIASSISGSFVHIRKGTVDIKMGLVLVLGGFIGSTFGVSILKALQKTGQTDIIISLIYIVFLGSISIKMLIDGITALIKKKYDIVWEKSENVGFKKLMSKIENLPFKIYFPKSEITVSIIVPIIISMMIGILVALMGIGGGFLMIPAMIYMLKMPKNVIVGTSLFQIIFIASNTTFLQAVTNHTVDIVLAFLMIISSSIGAQFGTKTSAKVDTNSLESFLALMMMAVCTKILIGLFTQPHNLYTIEMLR